MTKRQEDWLTIPDKALWSCVYMCLCVYEWRNGWPSQEIEWFVLGLQTWKEETTCIDNKHTDNLAIMIAIKFAALFC